MLIPWRSERTEMDMDGRKQRSQGLLGEEGRCKGNEIVPFLCTFSVLILGSDQFSPPRCSALWGSHFISLILDFSMSVKC